MSETIVLRDITSPLVFCAHSPKVCFNYYAPPADGPGDPSPNDLELVLGTRDQDTRRLPVHDVRGREDAFNFKENGFRYVTHLSSLDASQGHFLNDDMITRTYYSEVEDLLREQLPGINAVHHLGHIIRSAPRRTDFSEQAETPIDPAWNKPDRGAAPAPRVHIDFTKLGVHLVLIQAFGEDLANAITKSGKRYMAFSIWRPIKTIRRDPLGICDATSVKAGELVKLKRLYPDGKTGENVVVKAAAEEKMGCQHVWYWMSGQTPQEVLMIKIFDSEDEDWEGGEKVRVGPHCSFHLEGTEEEAVRESIEVRVVVCF
jgi:hypothetical protein